jgi:hypothetical protein
MSSKAVGCDVGTMFFQVAEMEADGKVRHQVVRNAFVEIPASEDTEEILIRNKWDFIKDGDKFFIPGEDALRVAKMFPNKVELRRPLADGVLNKGEDKKLLVLDQIIAKTVGKAPDNKSVVCTCISSPPVDGSSDSEFHKRRLEALFKSKGWNVKIIEEGHAVVLSERPTVVEKDGTESPYSGIGISFGAGRVNCVLTYKGIKVVGMSASRSGDWIDKKVSDETGRAIAQVTSLKETKLDFDNIDVLSMDEKDGEVLYAMDCMYSSMFEYILTMFAAQFQKVSSEIDAPLDIVIAGGTSMPKGFVKKFEQVVRGLELPFKVKTVRHAKDPRNAVVEGCLAYAVAAQRKLEKGTVSEES